ncbi:MAG TPA: SGNH/GDSL hydrolase family protein [Gammaproteobacteria bacterium]|nr:SGNH/GDSL hydrolase family protein [Gammaproteobacteria bacterium]
MAALRYFLITMIIVFGFCNASLVYADPVDEIIVFGDSLSDTGNLYSFTQKAHQVIASIPIIPKNPYYQGRFTNGPNWIDDLHAAYQVPVDNYAYGGSWAEPLMDSKLNIPFGLDMQMDDYFLHHPFDMHRDKHLYIIWSGSNDYAHGRDNPDYATTNAVNSIRRQIEWLADYGAKNIFVIGVPDLSLVPEVRVQGADVMQAAHAISTMHNQKLATMIKEVQGEYPNLNLLIYDIIDDFNDIFNHPEKYNLKTTLSACYNGSFYLAGAAMNATEVEAAKSVHLDLLTNPSLRAAYTTSLAAAAGDMMCSNPDDYLFFDTIHPTRGVHQLIADKAFAFLQTRGLTPPTLRANNL